MTDAGICTKHHLPPFYDIPVGGGRDSHGLFEQALEELAASGRGAPIEPECELIQISADVSLVDAPLVGPKQPALEHPAGAPRASPAATL